MLVVPGFFAKFPTSSPVFYIRGIFARAVSITEEDYPPGRKESSFTWEELGIEIGKSFRLRPPKSLRLQRRLVFCNLCNEAVYDRNKFTKAVLLALSYVSVWATIGVVARPSFFKQYRLSTVPGAKRRHCYTWL